MFFRGAVTIIIFGTWAVTAAMAAARFFLAYKIGAAAYLGILTVLFAVGGVCFLHWLDTKGAAHFAEL